MLSGRDGDKHHKEKFFHNKRLLAETEMIEINEHRLFSRIFFTVCVVVARVCTGSCSRVVIVQEF